MTEGATRRHLLAAGVAALGARLNGSVIVDDRSGAGGDIGAAFSAGWSCRTASNS